MDLPHGLIIIKDFINEYDENNLIASITLQKWNTKLKRYTRPIFIMYLLIYTDLIA
jgi:hypothetical protein